MKANNNTAIYPATVYADRELTRRARREDTVGWMKWGHSIVAAIWDESTKNWIPAILATRIMPAL